ncbi:Hydroxysteroid dehydrogenase-like protein 1-like 1 [Homarus americanus]|uniref:Hydroxysteroid dehydrogenase-like protein 1-like 1 n=1 Tax=Homarus americanus TaxID=6706 RepID=A0A8J5JNG0_HOMAM|nr:Hydroxysteroid dehydrogenase-like protein 1-like 1 [Homarus americanus]
MGCDALIPGLGDFEYVLTVVGLLYVVKLAIQTLWAIVNGIRDHWWSRLWKKHLVEDYGKWAVVTGCSDGIGKEYAKELAKSGMNIILISRTLEKLQKVSTEIGQEYGVETEIVQLDFMTGRPIYEDIAKHLEDKEIGVLVNNVGVMLSHPMEFELSSDKDIWNHINVNMASVPAMTKLILPGMLSRGKGAIINVASIAGLHPIPLMGIYSASKAFVDYFSQALDWEYRGSGITVQTVTPSYVHMVETFVNKWMFMYGNYMWNSYLLWNMKKNQA